MKCAKWFLLICMINMACKGSVDQTIVDNKTDEQVKVDTIPASIAVTPQQIPIESNNQQLITAVTGHELVTYATTLLGTPYKYASSNVDSGFDCSGFITYVFNHFHIDVPRSSVDFTNTGKEVMVQNAKEGDLVLFTGTVDSIRIVGHMGIVTNNTDTLQFIHSTSGKANGVTISSLNDYYQRRFVKVIRVLPG